MSTPGTLTATPGTLSKKERKQLRKQMMERKEQLLAKHGRGPAASNAGKGGSTTRFADIKPKLPADPPKSIGSKLPTWTPPEPQRTLAATTPKPASSRFGRSLRPRVRDEVVPATPSPTVSVVRDLDDAGPGPLTRAAAALENTTRRAVRLWQDRPWQDHGEATRSETHRGLSLMIKPLRTLGLVAVVGAVVLGRESRLMGVSDTGSFVVLGMGLALAIVLLAMAEIAGALRTIVRRL